VIIGVGTRLVKFLTADKTVFPGHILLVDAERAIEAKLLVRINR